METFDKKQNGEKCHEFGAKVITEDRKRKTSFGKREPAPLHQMLQFE